MNYGMNSSELLSFYQNEFNNYPGKVFRTSSQITFKGCNKPSKIQGIKPSFIIFDDLEEEKCNNARKEAWLALFKCFTSNPQKIRSFFRGA